MVFSSLIFLFFFLPAVLLCYYIVPQRHLAVRNGVLLAFSLFFYFYGEPRLIVLLLVSIFVNFIFGLLMRSPHRKIWLTLCVIFNIAMLGVCKYLNFFISAANSLFGTSLPLTGIVMPIGISFYTFQALSYVIDVYRREAWPQKNPFSLALYVSMFPQLIAGPIVRYRDVDEQIAQRTHTASVFSAGIDRFVYGLSKKVLLSNVFAQIADGVFGRPTAELTSPLAWFGAIAYTLQIYYDFSGYSDMAIGLGQMFGFHFLENFNYPYISRSVTEFWRRWHMSLSTWFRDYVYIPLGGNRCPARRHIFNLLVVWGLTGFWHGANFTFLAWGLYFGVLLIVEKYALARVLDRLPRILTHVYALFFIVIGWVLFRSDTLSYALDYLQVMFTPSLTTDPLATEYLMRFWPYLLFGVVLSAPLYQRIAKSRAYAVLRYPLLAVLFVLCVMSLLTNSYNPFIYFRF